VDLAALAEQCAPTVAVETVVAIVSHESRRNPFAIGINGGARLSRQPVSKAEAIDVATRLLKMSVSIDLGLAQINSANLPRFGISLEQAFDSCFNLRAAEKVLRGCYDPAASRYGAGQVALQAALSCYNAGGYAKGLANGFVQSVYRMARTAR